IISLKREIDPRNPQHTFKRCEACGSTTHAITDHYDTEWFKRGEALHAKKTEALKSTRAESSNANRSKTPIIRPVTPRSINHEKYILVIVDEYSRTPRNFDEKADDGYLLGYSLVSKAFRVFNIRRQQTEETYHITFDESPDAMKFSKPSVDNINIAKNERYPTDEYLHPYEPSQTYQTNSNDVPFIEHYERLKLVVFEIEVLPNKNGQTDQNDNNDQNDQSVQNDKILNDDHSE
nr:retrovirus-related Pol polyprotein from transposon TNT 1-94 [Tanacetum cinerariifolium]